MSTAREKRHMARVGALGCVVCKALDMRQETRTEVHHLREDQGMGQRASNWLTVALCTDHHTGPSGLHGDRTYMRILKWDETDLLSATLAELMP